MNNPHFCLRVEFALTDVDDLREYHVVLGGAQRGGLSVLHGYLPAHGQEVATNVDAILCKLNELLENYVCTFSYHQLSFDSP